MRRRWARRTGGAVAVLVVASVPLVAPAAAKKTSFTGPAIAITFVNRDATSSTTPARNGALAAVKTINRSGGIGGRPIQLTECLTDQTPERGKACMDQAAATKPTAVLAVQPGTAADSLASLAPAGVPYVAQSCNTNSTLSGQFATFCFGSDFVGLFSSSASYLKTLGTVKRAALAYVNVPAATSGVKAYAVPIFQRAGITAVEVPIPETTTDASSVITPAFQTPPDALVGLMAGPACISTMQARAPLGGKPFVLPSMCTDHDVLNDTGTGAKGTLFVRQTLAMDRKNPDVKTYRKAMARYAHETDADDVYAQAGFAAVMNLASALRLVPAGTTVDAASTTAALKTAKAVPLFLGGRATYTCDGTALAGLPSLCSVQAHVVEYQGKQRWLDKGLF
jgi:branched-chain amino acid transport system substrate-binding protein